MICPSCSHDNIDGNDVCDNCAQDLTGLDQPTATSTIEARIMEATIESLKPNEAVTIAPNATLEEAVALLCDKRIGCVIVGTGGAIDGILSERDLLLRVADRYGDVKSTPVSEFMTPAPETLEITSPVAFALNRMSLGDFRHLPVTRDGKLVGIVSLRDVLGILSEHYPDLLPAS